MKKLLSILTITTLTASVPAPLLANTVQPRIKHDIGIIEKDVTDGMQIQMSNIKDLSELNWTDLNTKRNKRDVNNKNNPVFKTNGADTPTEQQIKEKIQQKYPHINLNEINVTNITNNSVEITIVGYSGTKILQFIVDKSIELESILKNTKHLGEIDFSKYGNTLEEQIKFKLEELEIQLNMTKINVTNITTNSAKITSNDIKIYTGEVTITYSRPVKNIITNTNLGLITTNGYDTPTEQQIKEKVKELNEIFKKTRGDIKITDITTTNAKINFNREDIFSGYVIVNFISNINLNQIITQTDLGKFETENLSNPTEQQIKYKLKQLNLNVDISKIKVTDITTTSAKITSNDNTIYSGDPINVIYSVSISSLIWE